MTSRTKSLPDFERDIPLAEADLEAMWRSRQQAPMTFDQYLQFLNSLSIDTSRKTDEPWPEPFEL